MTHKLGAADNTGLNNTTFEELYYGKKVIIIGPSRNVFKRLRDNKVSLDAYDLVIKLNHHWMNIKEEEFKRTDIVYHGLNINKTKLKQINAMAKQNFLVVARKITKHKLNNYILIKSAGVECLRISEDFLKSTRRKLKSCPLIGTLCVLHVASFKPALIDCYGLDFYKTSYFKVHGRRLMKNNSRLSTDNGGIHSIRRQQRKFLKIIKKIPFINFF